MACRSISLLYNSFHRYLTEVSIFGSATQSPLITDCLLICLCLDFGICCHVCLFPLNLRPELLSSDTSANWYPLDIVSAFLLHPRSSELWLSPTFPHHIDSLPWFSLPNFSARLVHDLCLPVSHILFLIHSYFSLSRLVIRSLGRHFSSYILCPPLLLPKVCKPNAFVLTTFGSENFLLHVPWTKQGMLAGKKLVGEEGVHTFVLEIWIWQHLPHWDYSSKESPAGANLLGWDLWGNSWNCPSRLLAKTPQNWIHLYGLFLNQSFSFLFCLRTYTLSKLWWAFV